MGGYSALHQVVHFDDGKKIENTHMAPKTKN
jgi:hypothetical protein